MPDGLAFVERVILSYLKRLGEIPGAVSMEDLKKLRGEAFRKEIDPSYRKMRERVEGDRQRSLNLPQENSHIFTRGDRLWIRLGIHKDEFDSAIVEIPGYSDQEWFACKNALFNRIRNVTEKLFGGYLHIDSFGRDSEYCIGDFNVGNISRWKPEVFDNFVDKVRSFANKIFTKQEMKKILEGYKA